MKGCQFVAKTLEDPVDEEGHLGEECGILAGDAEEGTPMLVYERADSGEKWESDAVVTM